MGLKFNFVPNTVILSSEINRNFEIITDWEIKDEIPSGTIDGTNATFTTAHNYVAGSLIVLVDGIRQLKGSSKHYEETGSNSFTFTAGNEPQVGQDVVCDYRRDMT